MTINEQAIRAAAEALPGIPQNGQDVFLMRITARAALEAAMPYLGVEEAQATIKRLEEENASLRDYGVECAKCTRLYDCAEHAH